MEITNLWDKLEPIADNIDGIRKDLRAGLVPNLPYFVIGNDKLKADLSNRISAIDKEFSCSYIVANYGNGKTNILRYLEYFFNDKFEGYHIKVAYWRADVDKYDLVMFLLYIIQVMFKKELCSAFSNASNDNLDAAAKSYDGTYSAIKDYVEKIKEKRSEVDDLNNLIDLGTGRKYTKGAFQKYELPQLTDYNRREVLVFFLNVLAYDNVYIIFAIDELEKIHEKSKVRFSSFLTSYRELIDLKGDINGHCLITAATDASGSQLADINPAFARRIKDYSANLETISGYKNIKLLANYLNDLLDSKQETSEIEKIVKILSDQHISNNNEVIKAVCEKLCNISAIDWKELMKQSSLDRTFSKEKEMLEANGAFDGIFTKFFDSLSRYVKVSSNITKFEIKASDRILLFNDQKALLLFLFSDDYNDNKSRLKNNATLYPDYKIIIFRPVSADTSFDNQYVQDVQAKEIITYDPKELMTLFDMYYDYYAEQGEKIANLIHAYTNNNL